ncbi:Uu.00g054850.m01.CDS01 [Anthostomella pinea]|uniref:Uu.00g054850.m01.CDS01 n=1 Tax=Anthostomella pinea TaxID=933095 RepID=A0AAI8YPQ1_9PEZI|nr:Uu.00g054850.m01.CDS01 [Anthostomella pinea]
MCGFDTTLLYTVCGCTDVDPASAPWQCACPQEGCHGFGVRSVYDICPLAKRAVVFDSFGTPYECGMGRDPRLAETCTDRGLDAAVRDYVEHNDPLRWMLTSPHWSGWYDIALDLLFGPNEYDVSL